MSDGARCHYCRKVPCECYDLSQPSPLKFVPSVASDSTLPTVPERDELRSQNAALQSQLTGALNQLQGTECEAAALRKRNAELEAQVIKMQVAILESEDVYLREQRDRALERNAELEANLSGALEGFAAMQIEKYRALSELAEARKALLILARQADLSKVSDSDYQAAVIVSLIDAKNAEEEAARSAIPADALASSVKESE